MTHVSDIVVTEADNGRTFQARVGDTVVLRLPESPTTGYRWGVVHGSSAATLGHDEFSPSSSRLGSPGLRTLQFTLNTLGTVNLDWKYARPVAGGDART